MLPTMVPKADDMPKLQKGHHEKYKDGTSDQGQPVVKSGNPMEMDRILAHQIKRSGTLIVADRGAMPQKKTMNLGHGPPRQYDIFYIACQKSDQKKKIDLALSNNP